MNVELPSEASLRAYAPEKSATSIKQGWPRRAHRSRGAVARSKAPGVIGRAKPPRFAPAGQSTQMIVGADGGTTMSDSRCQRVALCELRAQTRLLLRLQSDRTSLRQLPQIKTPLMREHRLYQADWLLRFYGFASTT